MKRKLISAMVSRMMVSIAACGGSDDGASGQDPKDRKGELTVWLMVDAQSSWPELVKQANADFNKKYPGVKVNVQYQQWADKTKKLDAALSGQSDVVELGNTETMTYILNGALGEIDEKKYDNSDTWIKGLKDTCSYEGKGLTASRTTPVPGSPSTTRTCSRPAPAPTSSLQPGRRHRADHRAAPVRRGRLLPAPVAQDRRGRVSDTTATRAPASPYRPDRKKRSRHFYNAVGLVAFVVMAFPVYWLIVSSLRTNAEIRSYDQKLWPTSLTFDNFRRAIDAPNFGTAIQSSLIICVTAVVGAMVLSTIAAFAIGRFRFAGRKVFMIVLLVVQLLPPTAMLIPLYIQLNDLGAINEYWGVIVIYLVSTLPFATWMIPAASW
ncbi:hypothetical protein SFUMM280S_08211 [Streptomyces fumanus]